MNNLESYLTKKIETGQWKKNQKLPKESELMEKMNVSKMTVRNTISKLIDRNYLFSISGKGVYVSPLFNLVNFKTLKQLTNADNIVKSFSLTNKLPKYFLEFQSDLDLEPLIYFKKIIVNFALNKDSRQLGYSLSWFKDDKKTRIEDYFQDDFLNAIILSPKNKIIRKIEFTPSLHIDSMIFNITEGDLLVHIYEIVIDSKRNIISSSILKILPKHFSEHWIKTIN